MALRPGWLGDELRAIPRYPEVATSAPGLGVGNLNNARADDGCPATAPGRFDSHAATAACSTSRRASISTHLTAPPGRACGAVTALGGGTDDLALRRRDRPAPLRHDPPSEMEAADPHRPCRGFDWPATQGAMPGAAGVEMRRACRIGLPGDRSRAKIIAAHILFNARIAATPCFTRIGKRVSSLELR